MITVRIFGGLGNQMFQYAAGRSLSKKYGVKLKLDTSFFKSNKERKFLLDKFDVSEDIVISHDMTLFNSKLVRKVLAMIKLPKWYHRNYSNTFQSDFFNLPDNAYIDGYFQDERYFKDIKDILVKEFLPSFVLSDEYKLWLETIKSSNSVSIHVRRGDYLLKKNIEVHGVLGVDYYERAVSKINKNVEHPKFFIFSDDEQWCIENIIPITKNGQIVKIRSENRDVEELILMSKCKHNITANSSYSWWGAWLNQNENKIICKGV